MSHLHQAENLLASPPDHLFTPHKHLVNHLRNSQTLTVHAGKVKTTFGINDFVQREACGDARDQGLKTDIKNLWLRKGSWV